MGGGVVGGGLCLVGVVVVVGTFWVVVNGCGRWDVGWWFVGCEMWNEGCGMRDVSGGW